LKLKTNIWIKLNHFDMWHNCEETHVKVKEFKKFKKNSKKK